MLPLAMDLQDLSDPRDEAGLNMAQIHKEKNPVDQLRRLKLLGTCKSCCFLNLISATSLLNLTLSCPIYQISRN